MQHKFSELHSFAKDTLSVFNSHGDKIDDFHTPLSIQAYEQLGQLEAILLDLREEQKDRWICNG